MIRTVQTFMIYLTVQYSVQQYSNTVHSTVHDVKSQEIVLKIFITDNASIFTEMLPP